MSHDRNTHHLNKEFRKLLQIGNESNCRWVFHYFEKKKKTACIGNPSKNRSTSTYHDFICESEGKGVKYPVVGGINVFFSVNQYFDYHINALLSQLHANYLDIDIKNKTSISGYKSKQILENILCQLQNRQIPKPNAIVSSGSGGWHLYWAYSPIPAYKKTLKDWKAVTNKIIDSIKPSSLFVVDASASIDPGRVLRLPGTLHFESQNQCDCIELSDPYQFDRLVSKLNIERYEYPEKKKNPKIKRIRHGHNIKDWWAKIYYQLVNHANSGFVSEKDHNRDEFLFISYVALKHIQSDEETAFDMALALNERFKLLPEDEAISNLSTARKIDYRFKKETLSRRFNTFFPNLNQTFLESSARPKLDPTDVIKRQSKAAADTNNKRVIKTQEKLLNALRSLVSAGQKASLKAISEKSLISYTTVKKYKKFLQEEKRQLRSASIYPPKGQVLNIK